MKIPYQVITKKYATRILNGPGRAYVSTQITSDYTYLVEVKKKSLIDLIRRFDENVVIGYHADITDSDTCLFFEWIN